MPYPNILERDTPIIDWGAYIAWCTAVADAGASTWKVRSDGALNANYGTMDMRSLTGAIAARQVVTNGLHITGPEAGAEFTCYAVSTTAMGEDSNVRPVLILGESPSSITSDAGGDDVTNVRFLAFGDTSGTDGSNLREEMIVAVAEGTSGRHVCFAVGMLAGVAAALDTGGFFRLSVRRLVDPGPRIIDARKI